MLDLEGGGNQARALEKQFTHVYTEFVQVCILGVSSTVMKGQIDRLADRPIDRRIDNVDRAEYEFMAQATRSRSSMCLKRKSRGKEGKPRESEPPKPPGPDGTEVRNVRVHRHFNIRYVSSIQENLSQAT